jgi:polar amino acid transport system substrate-binding protein
MRNWLATLCVFVCVFPGPKALAKPIVVNVVTDTWVGFTNPDGSGYYFDLLGKIFPPEQWQLNVRYLPYARSLRLLEQNKADIVLGVYAGVVPRGEYCAYPVERDTVDAALTPEMAANWQGLVSLQNKKVKAMISYRFDELVPVPMYYEESANLQDMLNAVNEGHIDAVLDYAPAMIRIREAQQKTWRFVIRKDVLSADAYFVFSDSDKGRMLKLHFDREHKQLIDSGEQDRLFNASQRVLAQQLPVQE